MSDSENGITNAGFDDGGFLAVDNSELNAHTYVYDANKELKNMTVEALPDEGNYRDIMSMGDHRPTIEELKAGQVTKVDVQDADDALAAKGKVIKFGWIEGVFMRCLLNIWGVMLFLRLTWVIGQCGILQGLLVITLCNVVTLITAISMSAVSTNGMIKGGGIYYMISRSLGPEFGGAIGIMFTVANSIAVATYLIGFVDALLDMLEEYIVDFDGILSPIDVRLNDIRWIGTVTLIAVLALAVVGMDWVTRVQIGLLVLLIASQIDFLVGSFLPDESERKFGFSGYSYDTMATNFMTTRYHSYESPDYPPSFFTVFGVFFPAVTGIVAGANLSGDLKNPGVAIPKGTLLAILVTYITYFVYGFIIGSVYIPEASGDEDEYWAAITGNDTIPHYDNCDNRECLFGSSNDQQTLSKISWTGYLVYAGCFAATLSSAIASLVGAPRVLQALARDKLYPVIGFFGQGYGANDDPFRGYILVFIIAFACTMIGSLDVVSSLLSNFFVAAYALINFSVFHATVTKSPGWRPSFKYYNHWVSLFGTLLCVAVMFLMSWVTALITFAIIAILYFYISYRKPEANWGSSTQAQKFVSTLKNVQALNEMQEHVKNYRPKILVLSGIPAHRGPLMDFANLLTKKLSLLISGHVAGPDASLRSMENMRETVQMWMKDHSIKAFFSVTQNESFEEGAKAIMNLAGLGKLSPNMILMGFKQNWAKDLPGTEAYFNVIHHGFDLHLALGILRLPKGCDYSSVIGEEQQVTVEVPDETPEPVEAPKAEPQKKEKRTRKVSTAVYHGADGKPLAKNIVNEITLFQHKKSKAGVIDVWWLYDDGGLTLLLPYILTTRAQYSECKLRVFALANRQDELDRQTRNMAGLLAKFRIDYSDVIVVPDVTKKANEETKAEFMAMIENCNIPDSEILAQREKTNRHLRLAELLRDNSLRSDMVVMTLPMPRRGASTSALYMSWLDIMTKNMPPFLFVRGNQTSVLTFYS
ncbi:bumetanide-sensitive sodium-(potassium)-chloride cotransporter-like isoform X2 [Tigriopus californicus]|uniref:bumetanide-sensitive sodium-(potassium)-chloride cotransporter-like isoform X2 n=1 Tax=Tigriopus californicus TaxID=6832 RepID=UPI0027DAA78A|nr:bumetanide-sensitive sodium-(potassium)-chloride cotransporter-like isoform X2 [Tigriopus californicus]